MRILSIQNDLDTRFILIEGDKIIVMFNDKRFSRVKLNEGFSHLSLKYIKRKKEND